MKRPTSDKKEPPLPDEISSARNKAGLTQDQASKLVYSTTRAWQYWEAGDRVMPLAIFKYFQLRTKQITLNDID